MRRLAMAAAFGLLAFALLLGPVSASPTPGATRARAGSSTPSRAARAASVAPVAPVARLGSTTLDVARASVPLPRTVAVAPRLTTAADRSAGRASRSGVRGAGAVAGDAVWAALARCESGGNPAARSANGRYSGAFQFSDATWHSLGYEGRAADHSYDVQLAAAKRLQARSGWRQWPSCARRLALL